MVPDAREASSRTHCFDSHRQPGDGVANPALNLLLDFDMIERGVAAGAPRCMNWYGAFGLMITIIWLYIEILRLLGKARS